MMITEKMMSPFKVMIFNNSKSNSVFAYSKNWKIQLSFIVSRA